MTDENFHLVGKRAWVAGDMGMVGSAILRRLEREDCEIVSASRDRLDLRRQRDVEEWVNAQKPDAIFLAAARVGGILANDTRAAEFIYDNLAIETNVVHAAYRSGVAKLMLLGSSCIYPKFAPQPITEDALLTGPLESTNQWYAIAKIAGIKLCEAYRRQYGCHYISVMPTNLYGPGDNFDLEESHVIPALTRRMYEAKLEGHDSVGIWGTGRARREFLHVDDMADACVFLMKVYDGADHVNVGTGRDVSIAELAASIRHAIGYEGALRFDTSYPDGTPRKLLDVSRLHALGWRHRIELEDGICSTYAWFVENYANARLGAKSRRSL